MNVTAPQYLLLSETHSDQSSRAGGWSFVLERMDGTGRIEVADHEPDVRGERLKLLAVVRGLESLEQPSRVTLITPNRFIGRGIRYGISAWKENNWQWERFGSMTNIKNADLWQRVDRARLIHDVDCRVWNFGRFLSAKSASSVLRLKDIKSEPIVKSYRHSKRYSVQVPSWTELAASVANRIIPLNNTQQAYSCA